MGPPLPLPKVKYLPFLDKRGHILGFDESFSNLKRARALMYVRKMPLAEVTYLFRIPAPFFAIEYITLPLNA